MLVDTLTHLSGSDLLYDIAASTLSIPTDGAVLMRFSVNRPFTLPAGLPGSSAESFIAPTAAVSYLIKKNGAQIGTIDFAMSVNDSTFTLASDESFVIGDLLTIEAPVTADATHDEIAFTLSTRAP